MTPIAHTQLLDAVMTTLAGVAVQLDRQRSRPLAESVATGLRVHLRGAQAAHELAGRGAPISWQTVLGVTCIARTTATSTPDQAVAPLIQSVHAALSGAGAINAAGFTLGPPQLDWDQEEADERIGACAIYYVVTHRSDAVTLEPTL